MSANVPTSSATHRTYSFGEFTLDIDRGALLRANRDIKLRPKSFEVLRYLVERQGLLVSRDDLLDAIWGQTIVTEDAVTQCLRDIRKALRDKSQVVIRTVPRRGYIFELDVTASDAPSEGQPASRRPRWYLAATLALLLGVIAGWWGFEDHEVEVPAAALPHGIAVLPFLDMSPEQNHAYVADGISEEILHLLAQMTGLRVIARSSSFAFKDKNVDIATIAEQLGVTHVLEGSVRTAGSRIRITVQLIDAGTSEHLWSKEFDNSLSAANLFQVQSDVAREVSRELQVALTGADERRLAMVPTDSTEAYTAYLLGRKWLADRTVEELGKAAEQFAQAIELDRGFSAAYSALADACYLYDAFSGGDVHEACPAPGTTGRSGIGNRQLRVARNQTDVLEALEAFKIGRSRLRQRSSISVKTAIEEFRRALTADPDFAAAHAELAIAMLLINQPQNDSWVETNEQIQFHVDKALELGPNIAESHAARGFMYEGMRDIESALVQYRKAYEFNPNYFDVRIWMANALGAIGEHKQRLDLLEEAVQQDPESLSLAYNLISELIQAGELLRAEQRIEKLEAVGHRSSAILWRGLRSSLNGNWSAGVLAYLEAATLEKDSLPFGISLGFDFPWDLASLGLADEALEITDYREPYLLSTFGDADEAIKLAREKLNQDPLDAHSRVGFGTILARKGNYKAARRYLEDWWQQIDGRLDNSGLTMLRTSALIATRKEAGDEAGANEVINTLLHKVSEMREAGIRTTEIRHSVDYMEGLALYMNGEVKGGLELMSRAAGDGFWVWPPGAFEMKMYAEPEFRKILERQRIRQNQERRRVLDVVCNDNRYAEVWQPMAETCEYHRLAGAE